MNTLKEKVIEKIKELGDKAPEYFGKKQSTINAWMKTGNIPIDAVEKVFSEIPTTPAATLEPQVLQQPSAQMERHQSNSVVPPRNEPQPPPSVSEVLQNHAGKIQQILDHINNALAPSIGALQNKATQVEQAILAMQERERALINASSQQPTLGQVMESGSYVRPQLKTLATYNGEGHPLDTGIAPTAEQVRAQQELRSQGGTPGEAHRVAGPAVPHPEEAQSLGVRGATPWTAPYVKR